MSEKWRDTIVRSIKVGGMAKRRGEVIKMGGYGTCLKETQQKIKFIGKYNNIFAINDFVISAPRSMSL